MRINPVTLEKKDIDFFSGRIPDEVINNTGADGYYTIGALSSKEELLGIAQFCVGTGGRHHTEAGINYIFVEEEARGKGVGLKLIAEVLSILGKSGIRQVYVFAAGDAPLGDFLRKAGFINKGSSYHWKGKKGILCWIKPTRFS